MYPGCLNYNGNRKAILFERLFPDPETVERFIERARACLLRVPTQVEMIIKTIFGYILEVTRSVTAATLQIIAAATSTAAAAPSNTSNPDAVFIIKVLSRMKGDRANVRVRNDPAIAIVRGDNETRSWIG